MPQYHVSNSICGARALQADPRGVFGIWAAKHGRTYLDDLQARTIVHQNSSDLQYPGDVARAPQRQTT